MEQIVKEGDGFDLQAEAHQEPVGDVVGGAPATDRWLD